jgi:DinB family protein
MSPEHRQLIDHIRASAKELERAVAAVPAGQHDRPPRPGEWSVRETLIHLRNVVLMVQGLRLRRLLFEANPVFADYDEATARREDLARGEPIDDYVRMIVAEHEQTGRLLGVLPDDRWARAGRHPELGPMSIELLARRMGEHTSEHAAQIIATARAL